MSCETMTMSTPKKHIINGIDEMYLIEDIEKKLESFNHLLERSTEKGSHCHSNFVILISLNRKRPY